MDHERQERDLQKIFDATQASYVTAVENTFALQERILGITSVSWTGSIYATATPSIVASS
jgi:hypothetical protein